MASKLRKASRREGAEVVYGQEECYRRAVELLATFGIPEGIMSLQNLQECGIVRETGFAWLKRKAPCEQFFASANILTSYDAEVTGYIEKFKFKKVTGVKSKYMMIWFPLHEINIEAQSKIHFKVSMGVWKSFPITYFMEEEDKRRYLED